MRERADRKSGQPGQEADRRAMEDARFRARGGVSEEPALSERYHPGAADNDVIDNADIEEAEDLFKLLR